jgi:hypothetical protein
MDQDYYVSDDFIIHDKDKVYQLQKAGDHLFLMYVGYMIEELDIFINKFEYKNEKYKIYSCIYNLDRINSINNNSYPIFKIVSKNTILSYDLVTPDIFDIKDYKFNIVCNNKIIESIDDFLGVNSISILISKL